MADADEDTIALPAHNAAVDGDLDDESQDYSFLSTLTSTKASPTTLRRGLKDFEPNGTAAQSSALAASRDAMHQALSYTRVHTPKLQITAHYNPQTGMCTVEKARGQLFRTVGKGAEAGKAYLLPEEALHLIERGTLDLRWPGEGEFGEWDGLPMSLQSAYAMLIGTLGLTLERYVVYAGLKRSGYVVTRGEGWYPEEECREEVEATTAEESEERALSLSEWLFNLLVGNASSEPKDKTSLVGYGFYRNYASIYQRLDLIPFHDPNRPHHSRQESPQASTQPSKNTSTSSPQPSPSESPLRTTYNLWKPSTTYKKSAPPPPDFRLVVLDARSTFLPTLAQLSSIMETQPYDPPPGHLGLYQKLKHGYKNVLLAVVDTGIVSYLRLSDAGFGKEKLWDRKARGGRGGMKGGRRGGRGSKRGGSSSSSRSRGG